MQLSKHDLFILAFASLTLLATPGAIAGDGDGSPAADSEAIDFESEVRPILASRCLKCHGGDDPEGGLNLADRQSAIDSGAIVPGHPDDSSLLQRVTTSDPSERMPPEGKPLEAQQLATLRRWVESGADWPQHWAYRPLNRPEAPRLDSPRLRDWTETPIDRFVARQLAEHSLSPSPEADRRALLRRASFDLLGVPPTPEQLQQFAADPHPQAWQRAVDRMLADPRYGERWARHWMDLVHFAETHGHDQDRPREHAWPYRDYLIRSFNADKPYGEFVAEQVAGDALAPTDPWAIVATGMLAAGPWDESSLRDIREDSIDRLRGQYLDRDDIVTTVMATFTSTSVHCARCHDHKFDPVSQEDYYALQAVFAGTAKANRLYDPDPAIAQQRARLESQREQIAQRLANGDPQLLSAEIQSRIARWQRDQDRIITWSPIEVVEVSSSEGTEFNRLDDGSLRAEGDRPDKDVYTLVGHSDLRRITAVRLEVLTDDLLPMRGPGRQDNGNLHLNEVVLEVRHDAQEAAWRTVDLVRPAADFNQEGWGIEASVDGNPATAWGVFPEIGKSHWAQFELGEPLPVGDAAEFRLQLHQVHGGGHVIGRFRVSVTEHPSPLPTDEITLPSEIAALLATDPESRSDDQQRRLAAWFLQREIEDRLDQLPPQQMVYCGTNQFEADGSFRPVPEPHVVQVLHRGMVTEPLGQAEPAALHFLDGLSGKFTLDAPQDEAQRRLALARWLSDDRNALVWRSIANRLWHYHFGRGLVDTPNDFGHMGASPTHPRLLDWLAAELRDSGGSIKSLHRWIMISRVYRQSSALRPDALAVDRDNRWLWRMPRRRLDAESFRDALLVASGTLDNHMGGPSARQFILRPGAHVTPEIDYREFDVNDPANYRRSVYRFVFRTIPDPFMDAMDCPDASQLTPERNSSLTALQAMATWNDKFVVRQSELLAERIEHQTGQPREKIVAAYQLLYGRQPSEPEIALVAPYLAEHGLANTCRVLINSNEFLFVE